MYPLVEASHTVDVETVAVQAVACGRARATDVQRALLRQRGCCGGSKRLRDAMSARFTSLRVRSAGRTAGAFCIFREAPPGRAVSVHRGWLEGCRSGDRGARRHRAAGGELMAGTKQRSTSPAWHPLDAAQGHVERGGAPCQGCDVESRGSGRSGYAHVIVLCGACGVFALCRGV